MLTNIFAVTAVMAATASAFDCSGHYFSFYNRAGPMSYQRIDPALYPGQESPHLHSFDGGNAVSASADFDTMQGSTCTTARIKPDKSLYWRPTLFWNGNNTGFYRVPESAAKIYYKFGEGGAWANVTEFPEDFNMIAGDPFKRADGTNPAGVRWACHQPDGSDDKKFTNGFPTGFRSCNYGFATEITFPACWNGKKLNPSSPSDHMAYPTNSGVGLESCPTTHRAARFPTIFIEFWYDISSFNGQYSSSSSPWVLSNGDSTGYGFHADFLNGWEKGVLAKATGETGGCNCGCGCGNNEMKQCFGDDNVNDESDSSFAQCSASKSNEITKIDKLPGCNPIQSGPARATVASGAGCDATQAASAPTASAKASSRASSTAAVSSEAAPAFLSAYSDAFSATVPADAPVTASIGLKLVNKGYAGDNYDFTVSTPAASNTPAADYDNYYPYPSGNSSTIAPTATGRYSSYPVRASSKAHGHGHGHKWAHKTATAPAGNTDYPVTPSTDNDGNSAEKADCKTPVTVTYTPTVYVSVATSKTASNASSTVFTTIQTRTITGKSTTRATASAYKV